VKDLLNFVLIEAHRLEDRFASLLHCKILTAILCFSGGWSSRPLNLFDEISGVTNNPSESFNAVIKRWLSWKELSLDALVQMFYLTLGFYVNEVRRGFCGYGT
jgi:hypothetical protein